MASKSKRRRRVLGASCILAALIVAGSSFAWFTSSDEVTNRLSANADYGVKIVESFAPPANWLPGQKVNKDVYATNTGSIEAMVKEEVNGRLAITYEHDQATLDEDCVQLTGDQVYAVEAGSFLAYKPSDSTKVIGTQPVIRPGDQTVPASTDFTPDKEGLYVFRRSINVTDTTTGEETFTYDGYYYVPSTTTGEGADAVTTPAKYYKVSNIQTYQDSHVATYNETAGTWAFADYMNDGVNDDGTLMVASASFRKETTEIVDPVDLVYKDMTQNDADTAGLKDKGQYLIAQYDRGNNHKTADAEAKAAAYDKAIHELEYATALATVAGTESAAADEATQAAYNTLFGDTTADPPVSGATADLTAAQNEYKEALKNYNNKLNEYRIAETTMKSAKKDYEDSMIKLYGRTDGGTQGTTASDSAGHWTADSLYGKLKAAEAALTAATPAGDINAEFTTYEATANTGKANVAALTVEELVAFRNWVDDNTDSEKHDFYVKTIEKLIAEKNYNNEKDKCLGSAATSYKDATDSNGKQTNGDDSLALAYNKAQTTYKEKYEELGDKSITDVNVDGTILTATLTADQGAKLRLNNADTALNDPTSGKQAAYDTALENYQKALKNSNAKKAVKDSADALKAAAQAAKTSAQGLYEAYAGDETNDPTLDLGETDGVLKIYIKLDDDNVVTTNVTGANDNDNAKWLLKPTTLENDTAVFYYTGLLEGGETSSKLIDYVILDPKATQEDYKSFEFDIDVNLKSAQINLDDSGYIQTDAAASELGQFAKYNGGTATKDANKYITWSDTAE